MVEKMGARSLNKIFLQELPVSKEVFAILREQGINIWNPELQVRLLQIVEFERGGRRFDMDEQDELVRRVKEILDDDAEQQKLIAEKLPPGSPPHEDIIESLDVIHTPNQKGKGKGANFRVRARTREGFMVAMRNVASPKGAAIETKRQEIMERFGGIIGRSITFSTRQSPNGRLYLLAPITSLPENLRKDK